MRSPLTLTPQYRQALVSLDPHCRTAFGGKRWKALYCSHSQKSRARVNLSK